MEQLSVLVLAPDYLGVFFFAVSGSLLAARKGFDLVGSLLLGMLAGLGGGIVRDVIIGEVPATFAHPAYFVPPVLAALLVYLLSSRVNRLGNWLIIFDAAGLALFCITGTLKALNAGMHPVSAALLGVVTSVGGGLLRDITANEVPQLFDARDVYATPAFVGAALTVLTVQLGWYSLGVGLGIAVVVFAFRILTWRFQWHAPLAVRGWRRPSLR